MSRGMRKGRGKPGGMGHGASGIYGRGGTKVARSKGGGNRKGGIPSAQIRKAHSRSKLRNNKIISASRGK